MVWSKRNGYARGTYWRWWDKDIEEINDLISLLSDSNIESVKQKIREYLEK